MDHHDNSGHIVPYGGGSYYHHHNNGHRHGTSEHAPEEYRITYPHYDNSGHRRDHGLTPEEYRITYPCHINSRRRRGHELTPEEYRITYPSQDLVAHCPPRQEIQSHNNPYGYGYGCGGYQVASRGHLHHDSLQPVYKPQELVCRVTNTAKPAKSRVSPDISSKCAKTRAFAKPSKTRVSSPTDSNNVTISGCTCNVDCVIM